MPTTVFISYYHDDIRPDSHRLSAFLKELDEVASGLHEVIVDTKHPSSAVGQPLGSFVG